MRFSELQGLLSAFITQIINAFMTALIIRVMNAGSEFH